MFDDLQTCMNTHWPDAPEYHTGFVPPEEQNIVPYPEDDSEQPTPVGPIPGVEELWTAQFV